jgi:hypothetical protein
VPAFIPISTPIRPAYRRQYGKALPSIRNLHPVRQLLNSHVKTLEEIILGLFHAHVLQLSDRQGVLQQSEDRTA